MVRRQSDDVGAPTDGPSGTPFRDLHPTSDIRFVIAEVAKLSAQTERLISDVGKHDEKIDELRHQATSIKTWVAAAGVFVSILITIVGAILGVILSSKGDAILAAVKTIAK